MKIDDLKYTKIDYNVSIKHGGTCRTGEVREL